MQNIYQKENLLCRFMAMALAIKFAVTQHLPEKFHLIGAYFLFLQIVIAESAISIDQWLYYLLTIREKTETLQFKLDEIC